MSKEVYYAKTHEYVRVEGKIGYVGISVHAQDQLGDIVFVELPEVGTELERNETFGVVESVKAVSDCYSPVSGTVTEVNEDLMDAPELINEDAQGKGWIMAIELSDPSELDDLLDESGYEASLKEHE